MLEIINVSHHLPNSKEPKSHPEDNKAQALKEHAKPSEQMSAQHVSAQHASDEHVSDEDSTPPLLNKLNSRIKSGESVAIVGASGAGKTTLLSFLAGLDVPTSGKVLLAGNDLTAMDEEARAKVRAKQVAFVFQNFQLIEGLTALQNVCLPLEVKGEANPLPKATQWLERVGLAHRLHHRPNTLSGGEQQRVALARAFACEAPLLFADEPTGSLDTRTGETIKDLLFNLVKDQQVTLVLVTHDMTLAKQCDRTLLLSDGQLNEITGDNDTAALQAETTQAGEAKIVSAH